MIALLFPCLGNCRYSHIWISHEDKLWEMADRIECPHCQLGLAGEGHLHRHLKAVHKSELKVPVKNWFHNPIQDYEKQKF